MIRTIIAAIAALAFATAAQAGGYSLDSKGKCHDAHGKFAKASFCKPAPKQCRDPKTGRFIKCAH